MRNPVEYITLRKGNVQEFRVVFVRDHRTRIFDDCSERQVTRIVDLLDNLAQNGGLDEDCPVETYASFYYLEVRYVLNYFYRHGEEMFVNGEMERV